MPTKKQFSAISDFITPKEVQTPEVEISRKPKQTPSSQSKSTPSPKPSLASIKTEKVGSEGSDNPLESGFIRWTTYIKPEYKKIFKYLAIENDTEIYRVLDEILEKELKKRRG